MKTGYKWMKCGLIGKHLGHSFSTPIHNELADYSYDLCELREDEIGEFVKNGGYDAFNVTIPYKKDVIPFLDLISDEARAIGAVNTVVRDKNGKLFGYNTDYFGFSYMIDTVSLDARGKKAIVLGRGGASLTVCTVLRDRGAREIAVFSSRDNTPENLAKHNDAEIIVNATPVGMYPDNLVSPIDLTPFKKCECVLDLIYNPARTKLMLDAEKLGIKTVNGLSMLVAQAAKAFEYFTGDKAEDGAIEKITRLTSHKCKNIVLIGMPGCGKSTLGKLVADTLGRCFYDADDEFSRMHGITPAECIKKLGEAHFRELETVTVKELGKLSGAVIATGGGVVTREENYEPLHQNGEIFFIERELKNLSRDGRPLSLGTTPEQMYKARIDAYKRFADLTVNSNEIAADTARKIIEAYKTL